MDRLHPETIGKLCRQDRFVHCIEMVGSEDGVRD